jgi:quinol monooxygenase YgiN
MQKDSALLMCVRFQAKAQYRDELYNRLLEMVVLSNQENGCMFYNLHIDQSDPNTFYFLEGWKDQSAFDFHASTDYVKAINADAGVMTSSPSRVEFMHKIGPM